MQGWDDSIEWVIEGPEDDYHIEKHFPTRIFQEIFDPEEYIDFVNNEQEALRVLIIPEDIKVTSALDDFSFQQLVDRVVEEDLFELHESYFHYLSQQIHRPDNDIKEEFISHTIQYLKYIYEEKSSRPIDDIAKQLFDVSSFLFHQYRSMNNNADLFNILQEQSEAQRLIGLLKKDIETIEKGFDYLNHIKKYRSFEEQDYNLEGLLYQSLAIISPYEERYFLYQQSLTSFEKAINVDQPYAFIVENYVAAVNEYTDLLGGSGKREEIITQSKAFVQQRIDKNPQNGYLLDYIKEIGASDDGKEQTY